MKFQNFLLYGLLLVFSAQLTNGASVSKNNWTRMFYIKRNLNSNIVAYEVATTYCCFDLKNPIRVFWVINGDNSKTEDLNGLQKKFAYGVRIYSASSSKIIFACVALPGKKIEIRLQKTKGGLIPKATTIISGKECFMDKIYVNAKNTLGFPKVLFVDLTGRSVKNNKTVTEHILNSK